ncbi:methionine adenosyltransferase domain-containing protein [uncultured Methanobrevibacter sp.]|uniref:methionine adenosyltransferase domain-containing protein n=1 Tax=uncultured Methanobrevibacter sp. TaxID=253161 RepID=UPI0034E06A74
MHKSPCYWVKCIAKTITASGLAVKCEIQLSYECSCANIAFQRKLGCLFTKMS